MNQTQRHRLTYPARFGFTLVELLVSTALVMLIMVLFAQIYTGAAGTIREQEGIAKNDQKARSISQTLRRDLSLRTFHERISGATGEGLMPLRPGEPVDAAQRGYFHYFEGDYRDDTDDVLSFTALLLSGDRDRFVGRCAASTNRNDPDGDDGVPNDQMTASRGAVVTYYLRDGNLCRRIMLLRDPLELPHGSTSFVMPNQPSNPTGINDVGTAAPTYTGTIPATWYEQNSHLVAPNSNPMKFLGLTSLDNDAGVSNNPLGLPSNRFGHNVAGSPANVTAAWPNPRTGEEILMTGVQAFDVKVWEAVEPWMAATRGRYVDLGHQRGEGSFSSVCILNSGYGGMGNAVFDTWHPLAPTSSGSPQNVPFQPVKFSESSSMFPRSGMSPSGWQANQSIAVNLTDLSERIVILPDQANPTNAFYISGINYPLGGSSTSEDLNQNGVLDPGEDANSDGDLNAQVSTGATQPIWANYSSDETVTDGEIIWQCFNNLAGVRMMRITVRYQDPGSELPRQVTVDHSFIDR